MAKAAVKKDALPPSSSVKKDADGFPASTNPASGDSSLVGFDKTLLGNIKFSLNNGYSVAFQFVPKIKSESNNSDWKETDFLGNDKLKLRLGSGSKKISMEWEYVCTDSKWNAKEIVTNCHNLKSYFFEYTDKLYPVAKITYGVLMKDMMCRIMSVDITYSDEVVDNGGVHPLHTKVSVSLEMAHDIGDPLKPGEGNAGLKDKPLQRVKFDWY
jgi:hypothetical protein